MSAMVGIQGKWENPPNIQGSKPRLKFNVCITIQKVIPKDGVSRIIFPKVFLEKIIEKRPKSLVGKFIGFHPNLDSLRKWVI